MKVENLDKLKECMLYFVENDMINSPEYKAALKEYVYNDETSFNDRNAKIAYEALLDNIYLFKKNKQTYNDVEKNFFIINFICGLTSKIKLKQILGDYLAIKHSGALKKFYPSKYGWVLVDESGEKIQFSLLSKAMPSLTKETKSRLKTSRRLRHCHFDSMILAEDILNKDVNVVTGNLSYFENDEKYTHSWVEYVSKSGKANVIDFTMNAIMDKDRYYKLRNVDVLSKVSRDKIIDALEKFHLCSPGYPLNNIDAKVLLLFFDEIVEIAKRKMYDMQSEKS